MRSKIKAKGEKIVAQGCKLVPYSINTWGLRQWSKPALWKQIRSTLASKNFICGAPKKECAKFYVRLQLQMKKVLALFHFITAFFTFLHLHTKFISSFHFTRRWFSNLYVKSYEMSKYEFHNWIRKLVSKFLVKKVFVRTTYAFSFNKTIENMDNTFLENIHGVVCWCNCTELCSY